MNRKKRRELFVCFLEERIFSCKFENNSINPFKHMTRSLYTLLFLVLCFPLLTVAQFRKYSNEFLNIGAGARGLAMGSAQIVSVEDATAGYWNPAGLIEVKDNPNGVLMHADYFAGIAKYDYAALAVPVQNNKRTLGFSLLRFAVDDIPNTLFLVEPDGSLNYNNIQSFSSADYAFLFSLGQELKKSENHTLNFGASAKIIYRKVGSFAMAWGFGLDAGLIMKGNRWSAALMAKDVSTTFNAWSFNFSEREKQALYLTKNNIPLQSTEITTPRIVLGGTYQFRISEAVSLLTETNVDLTFDGKRNTILSSNPISIDPHLGIEASIKKSFFIRAGVTNFQQGLADKDTVNQKRVWIYQPSMGAGFKIKNLTIDYAFTNLANQESPLYTHVFSLKLNFIKKNEN